MWTRDAVGEGRKLIEGAGWNVALEDRRISGLVGGWLWLAGGVTAVVLTLLPGIVHRDVVPLLVLGLAACAWGTVTLLAIDWDQAPRWMYHVPVVAALGANGVAIAASGGAESPVWVNLFFIAGYIGYFFEARITAVYLVGCLAAHASVLFYDPAAAHEGYLSELLIGGFAYVVAGACIHAAKRAMRTVQDRFTRLAAEQGALRRVATAVVDGEPAEAIYVRVSHELAQLLDAGAAGILRVEDSASAVVIGAWADHDGGRYEPGTIIPISAGSDVAEVLRTGHSVRVDYHDAGSPVDRLGYRSSIVAPVRVGGEIWGALAVSAAARDHFTAHDEQHLMEFGDLLSTAIASLDDRARLAAQALTDPLTGLANHRALQRRLRAELGRAVRHNSSLSVAVLDIDHFKQINDSGGHEAGDEMLAAVAKCLTRLARAEDTLGRLGGDEFAWILPETNREVALVAVERARRMIVASLRRPYRVTVSSGICDTTVTSDPAQLISFADSALYWSKAHGRNQCWLYDPEVMGELSDGERAERMRRGQALVGLRALARAIDAKDPATSRHSERVSELVRKLALTVGWSEQRAQLLSEAALVHDVGKIGIPDNLLRKAGPLTEAERELITTHAEMAARIVEDVLTPEQVAWIRTHHERPDGSGYPFGLRGHQIPEGGALLAAADAWDVMTSQRAYSSPKSPEDAMVECIELVGRQFSKTAVAALARLHAAGELGRGQAEEMLAAV